DLGLLGVAPEVAHRELLYLLKAGCVIAEHLGVEVIGEDDLIRLGPAGSVHLELVGNAEYLGAVSEDVWYDRQSVAEEVARRIAREDHYAPATTFGNAEALIGFLTGKEA